MNPFFEIPPYHDYISPSLARHLVDQGQPIEGIAGMIEVRGKGEAAGALETQEAMQFLASLYESVKTDLAKVLSQRIEDRAFLDERVRACAAFNRELGTEVADPDYISVIGLEDAKGRVVIGPLCEDFAGRSDRKPVAPLPEFLKGPHVTLFGPPDSAKMSINAMNAFHRKLPNEPEIVGAILNRSEVSPFWGADDEDSKTPLRQDLVEAGENLSRCFEGTLTLSEGSKSYELAKDRLALPIKRFPGLALPSTFLFLNGNPIPLHLYDFALHLFRNWKNPRALVFYVPKLENEEEARYIHTMISRAEDLIHAAHPSYIKGSVRLMIVLENPRAILRAHEIMDALHPFFAGASLGWHDYLASTARLLREDSGYRIPVKADPDIVIKYIKASHLLLSKAVGSRGGIQVGGMYGILPTAGDANSLHVTLKGFVKDVVTQMKRELTGFWVAHPDFVRIGIALVEAWKNRVRGDRAPLDELVKGLLPKEMHSEIVEFIDGPDIDGLDENSPGYVRSLLVADIKESDFIANNHPDEIRYNVFQSLQYLTDWLSGNGCVALPTIVGGIPVRVMDDLATAERSRWEVWHEIRHGRFSVDDFLRIAHEEMNFIRRDLSNDKKIVQVKWDDRTSRWYPIAFRIMLKLMLDPNPPEFATELLMPFTVPDIRTADDPWEKAISFDVKKYALDRYAQDFDRYFEVCGSRRFAREMAAKPIEDVRFAETLIMSFTLEEVIEAAGFHGNIGESKKTLDKRAANEQAKVIDETEAVKAELRDLGTKYLSKFGVKFLISAKGRSASEIRSELVRRMELTAKEELENSRRALWEISKKRLLEPPHTLIAGIEELRANAGIDGIQIAVNYRGVSHPYVFGHAIRGLKPVAESTAFQYASLSKMIASCFAIQYFNARGIALSQSVNRLFEHANSGFRVGPPNWGDKVTIEMLLNHTALNMHYVPGLPSSSKFPAVLELLEGGHGYTAAKVEREPGKTFSYSGGGFLVLEHLLEALEQKPVAEIIEPFLKHLGMARTDFNHSANNRANGYFDTLETVPGGSLEFPAFAAGGWGPATDMATFLRHLGEAYRSIEGSGGIAHDTAVTMLQGADKGSREFMGCDMGLGVFVAEAGANRLAIHQGANEGFRAISVHCFKGPDCGKGVVVFCNADNKSVGVLAEITKRILGELELTGFDPMSVEYAFDSSGLEQEQIVNLGYKELLFKGFLPDLPEESVPEGKFTLVNEPLSDYNLVAEASVERVSNQKFARAKNLISLFQPVFDPEFFGRQGKIMDSWESARHNPLPEEFLILKLERPTMIRFVRFSTMFHDGNHPEFVRLLGYEVGADERGTSNWTEIVPKTLIQGHSYLQVAVDADVGRKKFAKLRVEMGPDGGLSRLGIYTDVPSEAKSQFVPLAQAKSVRFKSEIPKTKKPLSIPFASSKENVEACISKRKRTGERVNWASAAYGAELVSASNQHYGPAVQVISPFPALNMFDGLESARSRKPGHHEEVVIRLGKPLKIENVVLDFTYFVNNNPREVSIHGLAGGKWIELIERTPVKAFAGGVRSFDCVLSEKSHGNPSIEQIRVCTYPDGGINRIAVYSD